MNLLYTINSPYARKVRVVVAIKKISLQQEAIVLANPDCSITQYNPLGKVPTLILDDGSSLYDSRVIVEFLDGFSAESPLIAKDFLLKISTRRWEALADGVTDAAVAVMLEQRKPAPSQSLIEKQMSKVKLGLHVLNKDLGSQDWCVANSFSLADVALGCALGYINLRFSEVIDLNRDYPNLARINATLVKLAAFEETMPQTT